MKLLDKIKSLFMLSKEVSKPIRFRLILYMLMMIFILLMTTYLLLFTIGHFSSYNKLISTKLSTQLDIYEEDVKSHLDHLAASGIAMSKKISVDIEDYLARESIQFPELNDSEIHLRNMEDIIFDSLYYYIRLADCSGIYTILDSTVNTKLDNSEDSRSGLYIKIANLKVRRPVSPELLMYRGSIDVGKKHNMTFHNKWNLEFDVRNINFYKDMMSRDNNDLNRSFRFSDLTSLPGTWENAVYISVPLVSSNNTNYGLCGFEISGLFYKLFYNFSSSTEKFTGFLCKKNGNVLNVSEGFQSGTRSGYFADIRYSELTVKNGKYFNTYTSGKDKFIGFDKEIQISPLNEKMTIAVMIPKSEYDKENNVNIYQNVIIFILLIVLAIIASIRTSNEFLDPIVSSIQLFKNMGSDTEKINYEKTNILEIDDLFEYLAEQDNKLSAEKDELLKLLENERQQAQEIQSTVDLNEKEATVEDAKANTTALDLELYNEFLKNIDTLTTAEKAVFNLYIKGHTAKEITEILFLSINTIKTHNKRIYSKLNVSSRKELMIYVGMMNKNEG